MSGQLFSSDWHLIADTVFTIKSHAQFSRHENLGKIDYIVRNSVSGETFRLSKEAYDFIVCVDGIRSVDKIWGDLLEASVNEVPTQNEIVSLLSALFRSGLIGSESMPNFEAMREYEKKLNQDTLLKKLKAPLSIKVPLIDPNRFLDKTEHWATIFTSKPFVIAYVLLVLTGLIQGLVYFDEFGQQTSDYLFSLESFAAIFLLYPVIKTIHEFGHAYAIKRWGGEVHEMGVMLLVFFPVPYVDASASATFQNKWQRILVSSAGMLVEIGIAAIAIHIWAIADEGVIKAIAYNAVIIAGISTILFNGNPLLRFDGYYVLSDYWEEPNLGQRSNKQLGWLLKKWVFRVPDAEGLDRTLAQNVKLASYSILSFMYRVWIAIFIATFVAQEYFFIGVIFGLMSLYMALIKPSYSLIKKIRNDGQLTLIRKRFYATLLLGGGLPLLAFILWPANNTLYAQGLVTGDAGVEVRAEVDGRLLSWRHNPGLVKTDGLLYQLDNELIEHRNKVIEKELISAESEVDISLLDPVEQRRVQANYALVQERAAFYNDSSRKLIRTAMHEAHWVPAHNINRGQLVRRGDLLGWLYTPDQLAIVTIIPEEFSDDLIKGRALVKPYSFESESKHAEIQVISVTPTLTIDYPQLTLSGGGEIATRQNREGRDEAAIPYLAIKLSNPFEQSYLNERVMLQLPLKDASMGKQLWEYVYRNFIRWTSGI